MNEALPAGLLLAFYGDDFTGSTATLEALAFAGLKTILFFETPDEGLLNRIEGYKAIGIAGLSRSKSPRWMEEHLPPVFAALKDTKPQIAHYKICSTFDSAPNVGSIGKAIALGAATFGNDWTPVFTAVPQLARWQAFGNLFAGAGGIPYRIDRHPVMKRHPVTPMHESDLRLHLGQQTDWKIGLIDLADLKSGNADRKIARETADGAKVLLVDAIDDETLAAAGQIMWEGRARRPFTVGSQGVEYALLAHWRANGVLPPPPPLQPMRKVERLAAVSGSVSPITAQQIRFAGRHGFDVIALQTRKAVDDRAWAEELERVKRSGLAALREGRDALICSARGPDDPEVAALNAAIAAAGSEKEAISLKVGSGLGLVLNELVRDAKLERAVISGGDSSGQACIAMGLSGVTALAPLAPGAPLCKALAHTSHLDGLEIALKGGQMGAEDFFVRAKG
ncbi:four-carbon acid sugar kinase family protein [Aestuariivirga sp.]|uniref:four-carbon acid sugar kinase family protein n=1 Tax=Aestuariivirga sp. TaxID=2650926 RepID=UPI0039E33EE5